MRHRPALRSLSRAPFVSLLMGLVLVGGLAACGSDDEPEPITQVSDTEHNDADVEFATGMIPHHAQALVMVDMTEGRTLDPEFEALAERIREAQGPEIEAMADWLTEWGEEVPPTMRDHSRAGHGDTDLEESMRGLDHQDMPGMMGLGEMRELQDAREDGFQDMWLTMMITHHEGAIEMARTQQAEGRYAPAVELAEAIEEGQAEEIALMQEMLDADSD